MSDGTSQTEEPNGVIVQNARGEQFKVVLMDEEENYLNLVEKPEQGVYGYENEDTRITMFLEEP